MRPVQVPITGREDQGDLSQPYQAFVQFYYAFNSRDINAMSKNWEQSDEIAMDNPLGGISYIIYHISYIIFIYHTGKSKY